MLRGLVVVVRKQRESGSAVSAARDIVVAATHGLLVHAAVSRLHDLDLRRVLVTDTVAVKTAGTLIQVCSIAPTLAAAIACLHTDKLLQQPVAHA
ncbi:MAG TPA: hypothetical protein VEI45_12715 [Mycobacterium sp.]|uniref:hypothetical protein n=1 Tax=Mycobacterium sp. TaxID=1785 RepID=UPI002D42A125|nr:hypothetical protein [Mycobacterium sp.]HXY65176.1 hypothetical protein [Mycobacterium sp.]